MAQQSAFAGTSIYITPVLQVDSNNNPTNIISWPWAQNLQQLAAQALSPVATNAPTSSTAAGTAGQIATDGTYLYVCVATNTWKRTALSSF